MLKMARMIRIVKIVKERNKLAKYLREIISISNAAERMFFFLLIFLTLIHICSCLWIFVAKYDEKSDTDWISIKEYEDYSNFETYMTSVYFTVTTITTVGYGDISGSTTMERVFCVFLMLLGVISFSFSTGSLSSIMSSYDSNQANYTEKLHILNEIHSKYHLTQDLYEEIKKLIKFETLKNKEDVFKFQESLPYQLRIKLSMEINKLVYQNVNYFKDKPMPFIAYMAPMLIEMDFTKDQFVYMEGEHINFIYFIVKGEAGFVLPRYNNTIYIVIA